MPRLDHPGYRAALSIAQKLIAAGHQAVLAGGCVRDMLLGVESKDFDVATSATPDVVSAMFPNSGHVGAHFGVVIVPTDIDGERINTEVATFRHDVGYSDGRRPTEVHYFTSAEEDVQRRDFTINGLLLDITRYESGDTLDGSILDYCNGVADLRAGILRAIGDPVRRFNEDKLRLIRAVRFAARFGFAIEPYTFTAIQREAANIEIVAAERIQTELTRILTQGNVRRGFELLDETHLLVHILPEVARMHGVEQPPQYHPEGDVWVHTLMLLDHLQPHCSPTLAWGMLLHDVGKPVTFTAPQDGNDRIRFNGHAEAGVEIAKDILARLKFSNDDRDQILALIKHHMQFGDVEKMKPSTLKRFLRLPHFEEHLALHYADVMSAHRHLNAYHYAREHYEQHDEETIRPALLLTGDDLIAAGYKPGPGFSTMIHAAEDAQLDGTITTRDEALNLVRNRFGAPPA